jgi:hypothetical protein
MRAEWQGWRYRVGLKTYRAGDERIVCLVFVVVAWRAVH